MVVLQKAFSRHEKIRRMLSNLEDMFQKGEVAQEQYDQMKTPYEAILEQALENLKVIRTQLKAEREQVQADLDKLNAEVKDIEIRGKVGELQPEQVTKALSTLLTRRDECQKKLESIESWRAARSSNDVGGYVDVDVSQTVEYRGGAHLDWDSLNGLMGGITKRIQGFDGEKIAESLGNVVEQVYKKTSDAKSNPRKYIALAAVGGAAVLLVIALAWMTRPKAPAIPVLNEKVIVSAIQKEWAKDPLSLDIDINMGLMSVGPLRECAAAGLLVATDSQLTSFRVAEGMDKLISGSGTNFKLHMAQPDMPKVIRFSPPAEDSGMKVSYVEYQYGWKPGDIMTSPKYQALRDAMRLQLTQVEPRLKTAISAKARFGLFTDGWSIIETS